MKYVIIKVTGDYDYGAITCEQDGWDVVRLYTEMKKRNVTQLYQCDVVHDPEAFGDDNGEWTATIEIEWGVDTVKQARQYNDIANLVDEIVGDYDGKKSTNWLSLIID